MSSGGSDGKKWPVRKNKKEIKPPARMYNRIFEYDLPMLIDCIEVTTDPNHRAIEDVGGYNLGRFGAMAMEEGTPVIFVNLEIARNKLQIEETFAHELHHAWYQLVFSDRSYHNETNVEGEALDFLDANRELIVDSIMQFPELWEAYCQSD